MPRHRRTRPASVLYVVATPIGNLEDITLRALRVLKEADLIACEDTRQTQKLLNHYGITTRTVSYHEHNEMTRAAELIVDLERGLRLALVTDAGMPGISDPGFRLISLAIRHNVPVVPVPGASAFLAALVGSGLPTDSFRFSGFLPAKRSQRRDSAGKHPDLSPDADFLRGSAPDSRIAGRCRGNPGRFPPYDHCPRSHQTARRVPSRTRRRTAGIARSRELKGEITLLIGKAEELQQESREPVTAVTVGRRVQELMAAEELDEKSALKRVAREMGISKSDAYRELQRTKS